MVDLRPGDPRLSDAWEVMAELRPHLDAHAMEATYAEAYPFGCRVTVLLQDGRCRAVAGWRIRRQSTSGSQTLRRRPLTATEARSGGFGAALLDHLRRVALEDGCAALHLDSSVQRHDAHRFYFRQGLHISSYHLLLPLDPASAGDGSDTDPGGRR